MLLWALCRYVSNSAFIDEQRSDPDFAAFVATSLDPETFIKAEKKDDLPLIIPAEFNHSDIVRRTAHNVLNVTMGVLDLDHGSATEQDLTLSIVKKFGHFVHTSFSHDPAGQHKHRAFVKFSRPVNITEWKAFFPRMLVRFQATTTADWKCSDAAHMFFTPGGDFAKYKAFGADGPGLDVDEVLALPLPEGVVEKKIENYEEVIAEEERGEIQEGLRDYWNAKLAHLVDEIEARPYPGPIYDLKVHKVFGLARGVPHIMPAERLRNSIVIALGRRYRNAQGEAADWVPAYLEKSIVQVEKAIADGAMQPWWPPKSNAVQVRPFTEFGLAERLVDQHRLDIRWEPSWRSWLGWNGKHWNVDAGSEVVRQRMFETVRSIITEADAFAEEYVVAKKNYEAMQRDPNISAELLTQTEAKYEQLKKQLEEVHKFALKSETNAKELSAINIASHFPEVITSHLGFNRNPWLLNFKNGTLDLRTGVLSPHNREDYITRIVPFDFDPDAKCPRFDAFMRNFMCDNERLIKFLWRAMGYSVCGVTDEQKMFILYGDGANGKSTFLNLMLELLGQGPTGYAMAANSENLLSNRGTNRHETWRMSLAAIRFAACQEVDEGRALAESLLKELTGSDIITGRKLYQNEWSYKPEFTLWLALNHLPHVRGTDEGIWRRLCVIPCNASFKEKPDRDMPRRLLQEAVGIWARLAREAREWIKEQLVTPREVIVANTLYRHEQDPLRDFIERWCVVSADAVETRSTLWAAYEEYCTEYKVRTFHERKRFYAALEKQYGTKKVHGERFFVGLKVKTPKERIESLPKAILQRAIEKRGKPN
jgi:putative DNA primase/helicase